MNVDVASETVTPGEAARRLGISTQRVHQLVAEGKLQAIPTPLGRLLPTSDVERLAVERAARGSGQ